MDITSVSETLVPVCACFCFSPVNGGTMISFFYSIYFYLCVYPNMSVVLLEARDQELHVAVSNLTRALENQLRFSARAVDALSHQRAPSTDSAASISRTPSSLVLG